MGIRFRYLMVAGAVAAMVGAPTAFAQQDRDCLIDPSMNIDIMCGSPGNVQIYFSEPVSEGFSDGWYQGPYMVPFASD